MNTRWLSVALFLTLVVLLLSLARLTEKKLNVADDIAARLESVRGQMVRDDQWITQSIIDVDRERRRTIRFFIYTL